WWALRIVLAFVALVILYGSVTFVQVWRASARDHARPSDAIVVLGAAQYDGRPSPVLQARLDRAYELYVEGIAPRIVTTGANQAGDRFTEGYVGFQYLRERGVPEVDLIVVTDGTNTWEELAATAAQLQPLGFDSVVLVSDGYHALRLEHTAAELGLDASVARTDSTASFRQLARETAAVSIGRIIGYRRLAELS
ncbi:MAG TPA: YdcF family protein, partial [Acidimicrobiales bacterium]